MSPRDNIRAALAHVPACDRDVWVRMGMAVKSELGEDGYDLWDEWSQRDESYRRADARDVWRSISPNGKVTLGTLIHEAKRHGYSGNGAHRSEPTPQELAERQRKAQAEAQREAQERAEAVAKAKALWKRAQSAGADHPYLTRKGVSPVATLREISAETAAQILGYAPKARGESLSGRLLVVPIKVRGEWSSAELIDEIGRKSAIAGGAKAAGYWSTGPLSEGDGTGLTLAIVEGVATALTTAQAIEGVALAALSSGNLEAVARAMRERYPKATLIVGGDLGNGQNKAEEAARAAGALLALPDFGENRPTDATDFNDLAQHAGAEAVKRAIANARPPEIIEPQPAPSNAATAPTGLRVLTLGELVHYGFPEREAILEPWLLTQSLSMIHSWRGIGKTHVALGIAYAVATGGKFLTWEAKQPRRVLYVDGEMPGTALQKRLIGLIDADERDFDPSYLRIVTPDAQGDAPMPDLAAAEGQVAIEAAAADAELIILDNISTLCRGAGPENDAESWRRPQEWALKMRRSGKAVLFIHHSGKGGAQRGSSKREDTLDVVINLKRPPDYSEEQGARFELRYEKYRNSAGDEAKPIEAHLSHDERGRASWTWRTVEEGTFERVAELANDGLRPGEIANELDIHKSRVSRHLKRARELGKVKGNQSWRIA